MRLSRTLSAVITRFLSSPSHAALTAGKISTRKLKFSWLSAGRAEMIISIAEPQFREDRLCRPYRHPRCPARERREVQDRKCRPIVESP